MASYETYLIYQVTDVYGDSAQVKIRTFPVDTTTLAASNTLVTAIGALIAACTNGKVTSQGQFTLFNKAQISSGTAPPPANATFPSVTDGARLNFGNSNGGRRVLTIPAPLLSDFKTNSNTVNPDDANVSALIAEIEAITDLDGSTNLYEGGVKTGRGARKRAARKSL